jgi:hypothetical protein
MLVIEIDDKEADPPAYSSSCKKELYVRLYTYDNFVHAVQFIHSMQVRNIFDFTIVTFGVAQHIN